MSHLDHQPSRTPVRTASLDLPTTGRWTCDPLEPDAFDDEVVVTSTRRLMRVAIAAVDAGARFALEAPDIDAAAWLVAPKRVFAGRPAIEACQDLDCFLRSVVLHGLRLGEDADPNDVDDLLREDVVGEDHGDASGHGSADAGVDPASVRLSSPRLLTSWIDCSEGSTRLFAFCGMVTDRPVELVDRIIGRYGARAAASAEFKVGFDPTAPMATAMISEAMSHVLATASEYPASPLSQGLDVSVEQRFAS